MLQEVPPELTLVLWYLRLKPDGPYLNQEACSIPENHCHPGMLTIGGQIVLQSDKKDFFYHLKAKALFLPEWR